MSLEFPLFCKMSKRRLTIRKAGRRDFEAYSGLYKLEARERGITLSEEQLVDKARTEFGQMIVHVAKVDGDAVGYAVGPSGISRNLSIHGGSLLIQLTGIMVMPQA